jgi:ribonuclease P protein component
MGFWQEIPASGAGLTAESCRLTASPLTSRPPEPSIPALYEAHLPAQQPPPQAHPRVSRPHGDAFGACHLVGAPAQGTQETRGVNSSPAVTETFTRDDRIRKRREFEECYASGVRVSGRHIQVFLLTGTSGGRPRLGVSVPRRVGNAVARNRVRRRLREIFRRTRGLVGVADLRLVINVRPSAASISFQELSEDYARALTKAAARPSR